MIDDFGKCTVETTSGSITTIECELGLWSVSASTFHQAFDEAQHYFNQYKDAGEYSSIIGGESVVEKQSNMKIKIFDSAKLLGEK